MLLVISAHYEDQGKSESESEEEESPSRVSAEIKGKEPSVGSKAPSKKSGVNKSREDSKMNEDSDSDEGLTPEERLKKEQLEKEFDRDIKLMEGLF